MRAKDGVQCDVEDTNSGVRIWPMVATPVRGLSGCLESVHLIVIGRTYIHDLPMCLGLNNGHDSQSKLEPCMDNLLRHAAHQHESSHSISVPYNVCCDRRHCV
jgi:hypothetical protein